MDLDHFVIHVNNDMARLEALKREIDLKGFPFEPTHGNRHEGIQGCEPLDWGPVFRNRVVIKARGLRVAC
jgi:hypothetical protein